MEATIYGCDEPRALASVLRILSRNTASVRAAGDGFGVTALLQEVEELLG